jgi:hypothetical protein
MKIPVPAILVLSAQLGSAPAFAQAGATAVLGTPGMAGEPLDLYTMGAGRPKPALTDLELKAVTRMDEQSERQIAAVATVRAAVLAAVFAPVKNDAAIKALVDALAEAELALALARADAFAVT